MNIDNLIKTLKLVFKNIKKLQIQKHIFSFLIIFTSLMLSGCVQYDLGINFNNTNNGELVQHIKISENLTSFSGDYVEQWLNSLARRARKLEGSAKRISPEEMIIKIPFTNSRELQEKFSNFFNYRTDEKTDKVNKNKNEEITKITSNLIVEDNNFFLLSRNHLIYDIDLRSLAALTTQGKNLRNNTSILNLDFSLNTPWGVKNIQKTEDGIQPEKKDKQLIWKLKPGELNHIEVVFWVPNILGIGTLIIILFVWGGYYLRDTLLESGFTD